MSKLIFPYGIRFQEDGRIDVFPAVEAIVRGRRGTGIRALFHLDSGATTSILPIGDAEVLGMSISKGKKMLIRVIGNETLMGYRHAVLMQFENTKIKVPVIFVEQASVPRILGREGLFHRFGILFHEAKRRTLFLDERKEQKTINALFQK